MTEAFDRLPPQNTSAERAVLGSCLLERSALSDVMELLVPEDFYEIRHLEMFQVLYDMQRNDKPVEIITVSEELHNRGLYEKLGGQAFLSALIDEVPTTANVMYHAEIVKNKSMQRRLIEAGNQIVRLGYSTDIEVNDAIDEAEHAVFDVAQTRNSSNLRSLAEILHITIANVEAQLRSKGENSTGYISGFIDLDSVIGGFQRGSLNILAARPSMGKTALALNVAQFGSTKIKGTEVKPSVLIFSLEMSAELLVQRMLGSEAHVSAHDMRAGMLSKQQWNDLVNAVGKLSSLPLYIDDSSMLTTMDFRTRCRRFKTRHEDLGLIVVDYLQLMSYGGRRTDNKQQEVAEISRSLKAVARELECPVLALSQLSRGVESRDNKKPMLSDLRDSGAIEQDADVVMMLYRPDYYDTASQDEGNDSEAYVNVAKNRNGPTREIKLVFRREFTRFFNMMDVPSR